MPLSIKIYSSIVSLDVPILLGIVPTHYLGIQNKEPGAGVVSIVIW